jgi:hypothetical protein
MAKLVTDCLSTAEMTAPRDSAFLGEAEKEVSVAVASIVYVHCLY